MHFGDMAVILRNLPRYYNSDVFLEIYLIRKKWVQLLWPGILFHGVARATRKMCCKRGELTNLIRELDHRK